MDRHSDLLHPYRTRLSHLQDFSALIGEADLAQLREEITSLERDLRQANEQGRLLRIGVVGQIKRGKSSFLNALLFDGEEVLPKAASPMTAALTRIRYGDKPQAHIEFYSEAEWRQVKQTAAQGQEKERRRKALLRRPPEPGQPWTPPPEVTAEERACMELVSMARQAGPALEKALGRTRELAIDGGLTALNATLADYVGAGGRFTPIVKSSELILDLPALRDIEIIDTPGINDPIVSRSRVTQQFMGQCDVIFFLSLCSQFLDASDMRLLAQNIPSRGIDDICLIGSLFDSVLLDEGGKYPDIGTAANALLTKLDQRAERDFTRIIAEIEERGEAAYMAEALRKSLPPLFISALAFNLARHWEAPNEAEALLLRNLRQLFPRDTIDRELVGTLANIAVVRKRLTDVAERKQQIMREKSAKRLQRFQPHFTSLLDRLRERLENEREALASGEVDKLIASLQASRKRLHQGRDAVRAVFEIHVNQVRKGLNRLLHEIRAAALTAKRVETHTRTEERTQSTSKWWNPFSWGRYRTDTISYRYANVHDVIDQVEAFVLDTEKRLLDEIEQIVDMEKLRQDILNAVRTMVDFSADDFDPNAVLRPVEAAVSRLTVPEVRLDTRGHLDQVIQAFNCAEVRDSQIAALRERVEATVVAILAQIEGEVAAITERLCGELRETGEGFIRSITEDLQQQIERLQTAVKQQEARLGEYDQALALLTSETTPPVTIEDAE